MKNTSPQYAYVGLGSNLGDRSLNLSAASSLIEFLGLPVVKESSIYETEPVEYVDQPWFLNQVLKAEVRADSEYYGNPSKLLRDLLDIESRMGRERTVRFGPRVIDIDLLLQDGLIENFPMDSDLSGRNSAIDEYLTSETPELILPHPRLHQRRFVLEPLCEIDADLVHPVLGLGRRELLKRLPQSGPVVRRRGDD